MLTHSVVAVYIEHPFTVTFGPSCALVTLKVVLHRSGVFSAGIEVLFTENGLRLCLTFSSKVSGNAWTSNVQIRPPCPLWPY